MADIEEDASSDSNSERDSSEYGSDDEFDGEEVLGDDEDLSEEEDEDMDIDRNVQDADRQDGQINNDVNMPAGRQVEEIHVRNNEPRENATETLFRGIILLVCASHYKVQNS
ncbi:acidic leucine-rich nuclear phosphoprotein 32 family member B-like [Leptopilina boulardi]|uniref:acidic leucine-rich nuclear phosphoprotein 32 family member B-like n=1 Tax=Leptopilina boulardi TaxID=63433 RepID=UPI0021F6537D|nr:acidic leucine-rich nuclear phosphoprotein 32 family member B-like [Leptopilina boulardi]